MHDEWLERWQIGRIGWHETEGNRNLRKHWRANGRRVLVPMCGKTPDLLWLEEQGNEVVGVELSDIAVRAFFNEHDLSFECHKGELDEYRASERRIRIYCGDYFAFDETGFDAHYDRGALVAVSPELRPGYVRHTSSLLAADAEQLVIAVRYDQAACDGPPFSITAEEMRGHWPNLEVVADVDDTANAPPKFLEAGLEIMHETVWRSP